MSADVRFHNYTPLGLVGFCLSPHNGNEILVRDPVTGLWIMERLPVGGVTGRVDSCVINDVPGQNMPYDTLMLAYLKRGATGLYINWLAIGQSVNPEYGIFVDGWNATGHFVGAAIRRPGREIQGDEKSELVISHYNRGQCSFFSAPAGSVSAGEGWKATGQPVELIILQDEWPMIVAVLNAIGSVAGSSLQACIEAIGPAGSDRAYGANTCERPGTPYPIPITYPGAPLIPGFWKFQVRCQVDAGTMTLGAALNSCLNVGVGKF